MSCDSINSEGQETGAIEPAPVNNLRGVAVVDRARKKNIVPPLGVAMGQN
jgi:hypothetical protein